MDVYASLSELIREKEERGQGTLLVDIFESVAARGRPSSHQPSPSADIGPLQLVDMLCKCGIPCNPDDVMSIISE